MSAKHTPRPWYAANWTCHAQVTVLVDDPTTVTGKRVIAECETAEDARLVAAAPELLEALRWIEAYTQQFMAMGVHEKGGVFEQWVTRARAAIAKATGSAT
jgi:hypothetical protein